MKIKLFATVALTLAILAMNVIPAIAGAVGGPRIGQYRL